MSGVKKHGWGCCSVTAEDASLASIGSWPSARSRAPSGGGLNVCQRSRRSPMKKPESAARREPCERRERPPGGLGSGTDCVWGGERVHEVHHVHHLNRTGGLARMREIWSGVRRAAVSVKHVCVYVLSLSAGGGGGAQVARRFLGGGTQESPPFTGQEGGIARLPAGVRRH